MMLISDYSHDDGMSSERTLFGLNSMVIIQPSIEGIDLRTNVSAR